MHAPVKPSSPIAPIKTSFHLYYRGTTANLTLLLKNSFLVKKKKVFNFGKNSLVNDIFMNYKNRSENKAFQMTYIKLEYKYSYFYN